MNRRLRLGKLANDLCSRYDSCRGVSRRVGFGGWRTDERTASHQTLIASRNLYRSCRKPDVDDAARHALEPVLVCD